MHPTILDNLRWRIEEADCRSLERFCKATEANLDPPETWGFTQAYILERLDNVASVFLETLTGTNDIDRFVVTLFDWCHVILPEIEQGLRRDIDQALLKDLERKLGPLDGRITGSVDPGKLAERMAHWKAQAIRRFIELPPAINACPPKRLRGIVASFPAVRRMDAYLALKGIGLTDFASQLGITDRTLRKFRRTGEVRRDTFDAIVKAMGTTKEALLEPV